MCVCVCWVVCVGDYDRINSDQIGEETRGGKRGTYGAAGTAGLGRAVGGGSALGAAGSVHVGFWVGLVWGRVFVAVRELRLWFGGWVEGCLCVLCEGEEREKRRRGGLGRDTYLQVQYCLVMCYAVLCYPLLSLPPSYRRAEAGSYTLLCFFFPPPPHTWTPCSADLVPTGRSWASSAVTRPIPLHGMNMSGLGPPARLTNTATRCVDLHAPLGSEQVMRRFVCICKPKPTSQWSPTDGPPPPHTPPPQASKPARHRERETVG